MKMVGRARLTYEELNTVVIEVEAVINSRPLSYVRADDLDQPLTPVNLLTGRRLLSLLDAAGYQDIEEDFNITSNHLTIDSRTLTGSSMNFGNGGGRSICRS